MQGKGKGGGVVSDLLPCPFCGAAAMLELYETRWSVGCSESGEVAPGTAECIGYISLTTYERKADALAAWNRRVKP